MKTIFYFVIASLICITFVSASLRTKESTKKIILQASDTKATSQSLTQSANIITSRLKTYGLESSFSIISDKGQIIFRLPEKTDVSEIEGLLTTKGDLGFYQTLTSKEIPDLFKNSPGAVTSDARLRCLISKSQKVVDTVENYLRSANLSSDYKLAWGLKNSQSMTCLYALKIKNTGGITPLVRSDIESIKSAKDSNSQSFTIDIKFKPESAKKWAAATKSNLGKPIAIAIDDKVFYTPVVKTPMESGLCEITGNFTQKEVNYFLALVNNDPLSFGFILK
jgi:preprotein translocase subunit SecD